MLDKKTVIDYAHKYADEIVKKYSPYAVVLFGSYANGTPHEYSDIDIAVVFDGFNGDWLAVSKDFWKTTENISKWIEPVLLDTQVDKSGFADYVLRTGDIIYKT